MKFVIVWNSSLEVCPGFYDSEAPDYGRFGGPMGSVTDTTHLELPEALDPQCITAVRDAETGEITLTQDPSKVQAKTAQAWTALRTERNARLAASDWTQLQDTHLSAEKKSAWADYRQALRDLPDEVTDPTQVDWPLDPTVVVQAPVSGSRVGNLMGQV